MGEAKQDFDESKEITKSEASKMIEELREGNARVQETDEPAGGHAKGGHKSHASTKDS